MITEALARTSVLMVNEAHAGRRRCIRTRLVGRAMVPAAHRCGVRHLAMEALQPPGWVQQANRTRAVPPRAAGYLAQPEMRQLIGDALALGWTLWGYEADFDAAPAGLRRGGATPSPAFGNWRMRRQARNLADAVDQLGSSGRLLVWCGWSHGSKAAFGDIVPMGSVFGQLTGIEHVFIDQTVTVAALPAADRGILDCLRPVLRDRGGTAGLLREHAGPLASREGADAFIFSLYNTLE